MPVLVQAGYNYSGAVSSDGIVYSWGGGEFGRLGDINIKRQAIPKQIFDLKSHRIIKLALG